MGKKKYFSSNEEEVLYNQEYKRRVNERNKTWRLNNKEKIKKYILENKDRENANRRKRRNNDDYRKKHAEEEKKRRELNPDYRKEYYEKNKELLVQKAIVWKNANDENKQKAKAYHKTWRSKPENKEIINRLNRKSKEKNRENNNKREVARVKLKKEKDPIYKMKLAIRNCISQSFKRNSKNFKKDSKSEQILGCSFEFFIEYILSLSPKGTKLEDFKKFGYHLDHKIPISIANTEEEIIKLNHYTNFQPLWWRDNLSKSNKII